MDAWMEYLIILFVVVVVCIIVIIGIDPSLIPAFPKTCKANIPTDVSKNVTSCVGISNSTCNST